jgi:AraC family transcriptional regulator
MDPKIVTIKEKMLIGMSVRATPEDVMTVDLWKQFMPRKKEISQALDNCLYSVQIFDSLPSLSDSNFVFTKWAAVEVDSMDNVPQGMNKLFSESGKYAVFTHHGVSDKFHETMQHIFGVWLPTSGYTLADRPHFALMDERYLGPSNPESAEDIYVPID